MHDASFLMVFLRAGGENSKSLYSNIITTWCFDLPLTAIAVYSDVLSMQPIISFIEEKF